MRPEPDVAHRGDHLLRIGVLDGDGHRLAAIDVDLAALGGAATDRVAHAALMDGDGPDAGVRREEDGEQALEGGPVLRIVGRRSAQGRESVGHRFGRQRELGLHDGDPLLEPGGVDRSQALDVHEAAAQLHDVGAGREDVQLVTLLDPGGLHGVDALVGLAERGAECAPLPSWGDRFHHTSLTSAAVMAPRLPTPQRGAAV